MKLPLLSRRTVLRGLGHHDRLALAGGDGATSPPTPPPVHRRSPGHRTAPNRVAFLYVPNGKDMPNWTPSAPTGRLTDLPSILAPLAPVKSELLVLSGLAADKARPYGDGGGDHARAMAAYLTGVHPRKTDGADIAVRRHVGRSTRRGAHR